MQVDDLQHRRSGHNLRLETMVRIRWLAVAGQTVAVLFSWLILDLVFSPFLCLLLINLSALLNIVLRIRYPANQRLTGNASLALLGYDILQLACLLYLTGGLQNPFAILLVVPVVISATTQSVKQTALLGFLVIVSASLLVFFYRPMPWFAGEEFELPLVYIGGMWIAIVSSLAFTAIYAFRVADEARKLADALAATELILQREQHISTLDGLAAAAAHELGTPLATIALVSKEMTRELDENSPLLEDAKLLRGQAERCREILQTLRSLSEEGDSHIGRMRFTAIMEEVAAPHRDFGVDVQIDVPGKRSSEPDCVRNPAILYGLGNLIENAVDFARKKVVFKADWDQENVRVSINDDGSGFEFELLSQIGEPFISTRSRQGSAGGLGLGLFIAKTLLERSGATINFHNGDASRLPGAFVTVTWPRLTLEKR